jgi:hypothetical protein
MQPEKWTMIKGNVKDKFNVEDEGSEHLDEEGGIDIEYLVFTTPFGKIRLEYVVRPVVLDKKTTYSKRIGSETKVDYVYSDSEKSYKMDAYKWDDKLETWAEIDSASFA